MARVESHPLGRQLPVTPPVNRSTAELLSAANSSAGMKNQPRFTSSGTPLASPLPVTVRKLLSFSISRVSLDT